MIVEMTEKEYKLYQKFISLSEAVDLADDVDIPTMVAELEQYVQDNEIAPTTDDELVDACNSYLKSKGLESLIGTEVVDEILDYVEENY